MSQEDISREFSCPVCSETFQKRYILLYHYRHHNGHFSFVCQICRKGFENLSGLVLHQTIVHSENMVCRRCGQSFQDNLTGHDCIEIRPFVCEGCGAGFTRLPNLISHSEKCEDYSCYSSTLREYHYCYKGSYNCRTCKLNFTKLSELIQHRMKNHNSISSSSRGSSTDSTISSLKLKDIIRKQPVISLAKICTSSLHTKSISLPSLEENDDDMSLISSSSNSSTNESDLIPNGGSSRPCKPHHRMEISRNHYCMHCKMVFFRAKSLWRHVHSCHPDIHSRDYSSTGFISSSSCTVCEQLKPKSTNVSCTTRNKTNFCFRPRIKRVFKLS